MAAAIRALLGYLFLVFIVRIVGRRPGKQLTPFEFVLIFFMGGLALTAMVADEASLTNAFIQIITVAIGHTTIVWLRTRSPWIARLFDGTALILLENKQWRSNTLSNMGIQDDDVMAMARDKGIKTPDQIDLAVLERSGEITVIEAEE